MESDERKKYLTYNCTECRYARTKCDRNTPVCRRCNRLGLVCLSVKPYSSNIPVINAASPQPAIANILQSVVTKFKEKEDMKCVFKAYIRWWLWMALERESENLLSNAIMLGQTIRLPFRYYKDIFLKTYSRRANVTTSSSGGSKNNFDRKQTEVEYFVDYVLSPMAKLFPSKIGCGDYSLTRASYEGNTIWWTGDAMEKSFITSVEANKIFQENKTNLPAKVLGTDHDRRRLIAAVSQEISSFMKIKFQFKKDVDVIEDAYQSTVILKNMIVVDFSGKLYETDIHLSKVLAQSGDNLLETLAFVGGVRNIDKNKLKRKKSHGKTMNGNKKKRKKEGAWRRADASTRNSSGKTRGNKLSEDVGGNNGFLSSEDEVAYDFDLGIGLSNSDGESDINSLIYNLFDDEELLED